MHTYKDLNYKRIYCFNYNGKLNININILTAEIKVILPSHMIIMDYIIKLDVRWSSIVNVVGLQILKKAEEIVKNIESATIINRMNQTNEVTLLIV